ncbi:MAG: hypothetical protein ABR863_10555 [Roseiarcus sp.]|jgi:hypothetical protein
MTASPSAPGLASDEPGARVERRPRRSAAREAGVRCFPDAGAGFAPPGGLELTRLEPPR